MTTCKKFKKYSYVMKKFKILGGQNLHFLTHFLCDFLQSWNEHYSIVTYLGGGTLNWLPQFEIYQADE